MTTTININLKQASVILVPVAEYETLRFEDRKFYAVSRRNFDTSQVGFVCGKVDTRENSYGAALREANEEIGLSITQDDLDGLICLYSAVNSGHWITSFLLRRSMSKDELIVETGLNVRLVTIDEMCLPSVSPFWEYNIGIRNAILALCS